MMFGWVRSGEKGGNAKMKASFDGDKLIFHVDYNHRICSFDKENAVKMAKIIIEQWGDE